MALLALVGCGGGASSTPIALPRVYPPVRANTPTSLIADPTYASDTGSGGGAVAKSVHMLASDMPGAVSLGTAVQERLYTPGPTEILRIVSELDGRTGELDTRPSKHPCLTSPPVTHTYTLPGGQTFTVKLQCMEHFSAGSSDGWIAFGFDDALAPDDAGAAANDGGVLGTVGGGDDFYLVEGMSNGMGGAYRVNRTTENVEAWMAVADNTLTSGSQVIMHMATDKAAGTLELALAGSAVGFCSAHLKTGGGFIFIDAKTNGAAPPGTNIPAGTQYCDDSRTGCFAAAALGTDLGGSAASCSGIAASSFTIHTELDASTAPGANVTYPTIYTYFNQPPAGVPAF